MTDLFRLLGEWLAFIWPLHKVKEWERGLRYRFGRYVGEVGPGIYWVTPWFADMKSEPVVPGVVQTPRIDITAQDGTVVTAQATATVRVADLPKAVNTIESYMESTQELITAVVADELAQAGAEQLNPESRGRLLSDLHTKVEAECQKFGVGVPALRFTTFVTNPRPFRLLGDNPTVASW